MQQRHRVRSVVAHHLRKGVEHLGLAVAAVGDAVDLVKVGARGAANEVGRLVRGRKPRLAPAVVEHPVGRFGAIAPLGVRAGDAQ